MSAVVSLSAFRGARQSEALRALLQAAPPTDIVEDEYGFLDADLARAWQPYFDALGLADVQLHGLTGDAFRDLLAQCMPLALCVVRWMDCAPSQEPFLDYERYYDAVSRGCPAQAPLPSRLAKHVAVLLRNAVAPSVAAEQAGCPDAGTVRRLRLVSA